MLLRTLLFSSGLLLASTRATTDWKGGYLTYMSIRSPELFVRNFRALRRAGRIKEFVSIFTHHTQRAM
jgi:hypothetical protein